MRITFRTIRGSRSTIPIRNLPSVTCLLPDRPLPGNAARSEPGTVLDVHGGKVHVKTGDGYLTLLEYEMTGNKKLKAGVRLGARS